jgi:hypothetical protein
MLDKNSKIKVRNKFDGTVGYTIPDLKLHKNFYPGETKEIAYDELESLTYAPGGMTILKEYLEILDKEAARELFHLDPEPEYFYSREDIKKLMTEGTMDQFLDCLDFAPTSVKEIIKDMAVDLPLNDMEKRKAVAEKLGFDVTKAIEIKETKYDGETEKEAENAKANMAVTGRRAAPVNNTAAATGRRYKPSTDTTK